MFETAFYVAMMENLSTKALLTFTAGQETLRLPSLGGSGWSVYEPLFQQERHRNDTHNHSECQVGFSSSSKLHFRSSSHRSFHFFNRPVLHILHIRLKVTDIVLKYNFSSLFFFITKGSDEQVSKMA